MARTTDTIYHGHNPHIRLYSDADLEAIANGNTALGTLLVNGSTFSAREWPVYAKIYQHSHEYLVDTGEGIETIRAMDDRTAIGFAHAQFVSVISVTRATPKGWDMTRIFQSDQPAR